MSPRFDWKINLELSWLKYASPLSPSNDNCLISVIEKLEDRVYITFDLDVFDASIMPSTGTPEPGGLDWNAVMKLLKKVIEKRSVVGIDVVELCPIPGLLAPDFLAAKLVYKFLSYLFQP